VAGRDRRTEDGNRASDQRGIATAPRSQKKTAAAYSGSIVSGEYGDGNIRGIVFIAGKRGSGKSFLQLKELERCKLRRLVFDTLGQYGTQRGYVVFHNPGPLREYLKQRLHASCAFAILYQPLGGDLNKHFEAVTFLALSYGKNGPGLIYAVDEVDKFCSASFVPQSLKDLINYGRHRKISMICTSRRPAQVARELTSQCAEIRCFRTTEPRDIRYFADIMGDTAANKLPTLGEYQYLKWTDDCAEPEICGGKI
jgi:hypothetical protein